MAAYPKQVMVQLINQRNSIIFPRKCVLDQHSLVVGQLRLAFLLVRLAPRLASSSFGLFGWSVKRRQRGSVVTDATLLDQTIKQVYFSICDKECCNLCSKALVFTTPRLKTAIRRENIVTASQTNNNDHQMHTSLPLCTLQHRFSYDSRDAGAAQQTFPAAAD